MREFYFESLKDFAWMSGHGPYVWICYFVTFMVLTFILLMPVFKSRRFMKTQRALARRVQAEAHQKTESD